MAYEYNFNSDNCWYICSCGKANTEECRASCIRYMEMDYLMQTSNIPKRMQYPVDLIPSKADINAFLRLKNIKDNILEFVGEGHNLYLFSEKFGNGKTTWSIKLMLKYFDEVWAGNGFKCRGIFINVPTFLTKLKENISRKDANFEELRDRLLSVDLVIWDDIAATTLGDYDHANLLAYIDQRKLSGLSNIYTGNMEEQALRHALGNRLSSRVWNDSVVIEFVGEDRRSSKW